MGPGGEFESCEDRHCAKNREVMAKSEVDSADYQTAKQNTQNLDGQHWMSEEAHVRVVRLLRLVLAGAVLGG